MKIESNLPQAGLQATQTERVEQTQTVERDSQGAASVQKPKERDNLNISSAAEKLNQVSSQGSDTQEFRPDKVAAIKEQVASNKYQVDSRDVAQKMISTMRNGL